MLATQPREWKTLSQHHGAMIEEQFLRRLASEIGRRVALDVQRHGIRDMGCRFRLAYFRPASGLNDHKVKQVIQEIVDLNFDLYKRITDDRAFGEVVKNHLFDQYLRAHRPGDALEG